MATSIESVTEPATKSAAPSSGDRIALPRIIGYGIGDFGFNFYWFSLTLFLSYYYTDVLGPEMEKSADPSDPADPGRWAVHRVPGSELEVAVFAAGLGDGAYRSWWGLGAGGQAVSLVTDFGLL